MGKGIIGPGIVTAVIFALIGAAVITLFSGAITLDPDGTVLPAAGNRTTTSLYNPPAPEDAPAPIKAEVVRGHEILTDTRAALGINDAGAGLICTNCHFHAGITDGGRNGGVSLVGAAARYPAFVDANAAVTTLFERVNDCLRTSLNLDALPVGGDDMKAVLTYIEFISLGLPVQEKMPWLGLSINADAPDGDAEAGGIAYASICAKCHGNEGAGTEAAPAVWGASSFTTGSPLADEELFAAFIRWNMPYGNPTLTENQAADIAAYVGGLPRPAPGN